MSYDEPRPDLRASDADREATAKRLHFAATEGRLDPDELDERLSAAYSARTCRELARLTADVTPPPLAPQVSGRPVFYRASPSVNGWAVASLVLGLLWMWWIGSALAIVFGHMALGRIEASGGRQGGRGIAIAGLALGYLGAVILVLVLAGMAID
jgi:Domain of unknown function (DUF1707)/Domain of unknown function (DUF4190)